MEVRNLETFIIGSNNPTKIRALKNALSSLQIEGNVLKENAPSGVKAQPIGDEETAKGAINRAKNALILNNGTIGIGLEGGVVMMNETIYLCNWGALVTKNGEEFSASGAKIPLPIEFKDQLLAGKELGDLMDQYCSKEGIRKKEGAIGIFTDGAMNRAAMFEHVVKLLLGQWQYVMKNKK